MSGFAYALALDGLGELVQEMKDMVPGADQALSRALNYATNRARTLAADMVGREVNLGRDYLSPANKKLYVDRLSSPGSLESVIVGAQRPISLARFSGGGKPGATGMFVKVKTSGGGKLLKKAFFIKLRQGSQLTDTVYNLGLAVRSKTPLANKRIAKPIGKNLYLLYGPSVDQVFRNVMVDEKFRDSIELDFIAELDRQLRLPA